METDSSIESSISSATAVVTANVYGLSSARVLNPAYERAVLHAAAAFWLKK